MPWWESGALAELACLSLNAGLLDEGEAHARESLEIAVRSTTDPAASSASASSPAWRPSGVRASAQGGSGARSRTRMPPRRSEAGGVTVTRAKRGFVSVRPRFERGYAEGRELTLDDAVSLALSESG